VIELSLLCFDRLHMESLLPRVLPLVDSVHLDVMDGSFTSEPGGYSAGFINRFETDLPKHVHAMVDDPAATLGPLSGIATYSFHLEAQDDPTPLLDAIAARGFGAGLVLNPDTPVEAVAPWIDRLERIVLMAVPPGKSGQPYLLQTADRLRRLREIDANIDIVIDGGMHRRTIEEVARLGATAFVVCSTVVKDPDPEGKVAELRASLAAGRSNGLGAPT